VQALLDEHHLTPADVMVLARRRAVLAPVAQALAALGIAHVVAEPLTLHETPEVLDLAAVLNVLVSPGHDLSLARALKSPLFGATDADLLLLAGAARAARTPWLAALLEGTPPAASPAWQRARELLPRWQQQLHRLTPHELLDRIVHEGDLLPRLAAALPEARRAAALHAVQAFVGAALHEEGGRLASAYGLLRALRAGRLRATAAVPSGAVQLLTVHGAKGLEARAVLVADADPEPRAPERALVLVDWPVDAAAPRRVAFVRNEAALAPSLADAWSEHLAAIEREETNGLYVAATRACEWLVFSRTEPSKPAGNPRSWWRRVHALAEPWEPVAAEAGAAAATGAPVSVPRLPTLALPAAPAPAPPTPAGDTRDARLGTAVHRVLEWAAGDGAAQLAALSRAAVREAGLPAGEAAAVHTIAAQVLASPDCARFFTGPQIRWAGNEVPLAWQGALLRIDRLVALAEGEGGGATWWVLDYKLAHDPGSDPALREQLSRYVAAVQALQPGDAVRGAFITGQGRLLAL
jgi:ATP-dependent helicase/nuclease subunit A